MAATVRCCGPRAPLLGALRGYLRIYTSQSDAFGLNARDGLGRSTTRRAYRAALCRELKKPLVIGAVSPRELQPDEVRVAVRCAGVNFADMLACQGMYQEQFDLPFTPGMEFSGCVLEVGPKVKTVEEGDRVVGVSVGAGAMAEECIVKEEMLWSIKESVSYTQAAALPVCYGTAILALKHRARVQPGETVLVTAAAGATGQAVVEMASNIFQTKVIAAAGSDEKCQQALRMGATSTVNYTQCSLKEEVKRLTNGKGVDVVIDAVGGDIFKEALSSLKWEGRIVVVGFAGGNIASVPTNQLLLRNVSALGVFWGRYRKMDPPLFSWSISTVLQHCQEARIQPYVGAVFNLENVNNAFAFVAKRQSMGKVVIELA
ncbi:quinone oxidoreductase-like protein 2 [Lissotriton helveticus]